MKEIKSPKQLKTFTGKNPYKQTNFEVITANTKALAEIMYNCRNSCCYCNYKFMSSECNRVGSCKQGIAEWLRATAEE